MAGRRGRGCLCVCVCGGGADVWTVWRRDSPEPLGGVKKRQAHHIDLSDTEAGQPVEICIHALWGLENKK